MSKRVNNYRGRHHGWKATKAPAADKRPERKGVPPIALMWMNWIVKVRKFQAARDKYRNMLNVKGKKALIGKKRQKVLDQFFSVAY